MPSRAVTSFLHTYYVQDSYDDRGVSMPSRAVTSFLPATMFVILAVVSTCVNALTGCYLISTLESLIKFILYMKVCQCPHGLLPHFYIVSRQLRTPVLLACQCPHGLLPHFYRQYLSLFKQNKNTVSMPSRAVTSFLRCTIPGRGSTCYQVSMPSRAVTSFLPSRS
ncbi:Uncharacterised protein [uncultured Lachnospira sp.]|nr:Uncharacterised protein [uncultured Lachnospira sp.]